ncbi:MAG: hypothetical protein RLZZ106_1967, partial [Cyanobacteriota bacterium]
MIKTGDCTNCHHQLPSPIGINDPGRSAQSTPSPRQPRCNQEASHGDAAITAVAQPCGRRTSEAQAVAAADRKAELLGQTDPEPACRGRSLNPADEHPATDRRPRSGAPGPDAAPGPAEPARESVAADAAALGLRLRAAHAPTHDPGGPGWCPDLASAVDVRASRPAGIVG